MRRIPLLVLICGLYIFTVVASAVAATTIKSVTQIDSYNTRVNLDAAGAELDSSAIVRVYSGTTLLKTSSVRLRRDVSKSWSDAGEEPGYIYHYGDYYALLAFDAATTSEWRAGNRKVMLGVWEYGYGRRWVEAVDPLVPDLAVEESTFWSGLYPSQPVSLRTVLTNRGTAPAPAGALLTISWDSASLYYWGMGYNSYGIPYFTVPGRSSNSVTLRTVMEIPPGGSTIVDISGEVLPSLPVLTWSSNVTPNGLDNPANNAASVSLPIDASFAPPAQY